MHKHSTRWIYLSFAGSEGFRGACIVRGNNVVEGAREAHRLGINPGGAVLGCTLPLRSELAAEDVNGHANLALFLRHTNRLMSKQELEELGFDPFKPYSP